MISTGFGRPTVRGRDPVPPLPTTRIAFPLVLLVELLEETDLVSEPWRRLVGKSAIGMGGSCEVIDSREWVAFMFSVRLGGLR